MPFNGDSVQAQLERYQRRFHVLRGVLLGTRHQKAAEEAVDAFLAAVCEGFGWPVGVYYAKAAATPSFVATPIRFPRDGGQQHQVRGLAQRPREEKASVFDGEIIRSSLPRWIPNVTLEPTFEATKQAVALGVRGVVGIPVHAGGHFYGLVEFFTKEEFNPSPDQVEFLSDLGHILGVAVHFHEVDRRIRKIRREQETVFERLPDPVYIVDRLGRATFVNEPAAKLFGLLPAELVGEDIHGRFHIGVDGVSAVPVADCPLHGVPAKKIHGVRRREKFRTGERQSVEVEAVAAPFVIDGAEETLVVLRVPG